MAAKKKVAKKATKKTATKAAKKRVATKAAKKVAAKKTAKKAAKKVAAKKAPAKNAGKKAAAVKEGSPAPPKKKTAPKKPVKLTIFIKKQRKHLLDLKDQLMDAMSGVREEALRNGPSGNEAPGSGLTPNVAWGMSWSPVGCWRGGVAKAGRAGARQS